MIHIDGKAGKILILFDDKVKISTIKTIGDSESIVISLSDIEEVQIIDPNSRALGSLTISAKGMMHQITYSKKFREVAYDVKHYIENKDYTGTPLDPFRDDNDKPLYALIICAGAALLGAFTYPIISVIALIVAANIKTNEHKLFKNLLCIAIACYLAGLIIYGFIVTGLMMGSVFSIFLK